MAKFKEGDIVILKSSVKDGKYYNGWYLSSTIVDVFNKYLFGIINDIYSYNHTSSSYYTIMIGNRAYTIGEDALELYQSSVHKYKVGDKVRIKKRKGYDNDYPCYFTDEMAQNEGNIFTILYIEEIEEKNVSKFKFYNGDNHCYHLKEDLDEHIWHSSMFEPILEDPKLITSISLKEEDLISICGMIARIRKSTCSGKYYLNFNYITDEQNHFDCCKRLRELVPDFEKIASIYNAVRLEPECFPEFSTIDDLVKFTQAVNNAYDSKNVTTPKKLNENEIRFQKPKASFTGGHVPTGRSICGRQHKITVVIGHLSNQAISC